jgi:hypothetical protein
MKPTAVKNIYANLRKRYPHATVRASTFDDFYDVSALRLQPSGTAARDQPLAC